MELELGLSFERDALSRFVLPLVLRLRKGGRFKSLDFSLARLLEGQLRVEATLIRLSLIFLARAAPQKPISLNRGRVVFMLVNLVIIETTAQI